MSTINPFIPYPAPTPNPLFLAALIQRIGKILGVIFKRSPKGRETAEEIAERNEAFHLFCDCVDEEAKVVEARILAELDEYAAYLASFNDSEKYPFLKTLSVNTSGLSRQLSIVKLQIPGVISAAVSRRLSDSDQECQTVRLMLAGQEKEQRMKMFLTSILEEAIGKCAELVDSIVTELQDTFLQDLWDGVDRTRRQLEQEEKELRLLNEAQDKAAEALETQRKAELVLACCDLSESIWRDNDGTV